MQKSSGIVGLMAGVLILASGAVYLNSLGGEFVYDDRSLVVENQLIRSPRNIPRILGLTGDKPLPRPVRHLSYLVDYQVSGLNPKGYHAFNILYHAITSLLVFFLGVRLLGRGREIPAFIAALLFAVHPVHTEAVSYISGRRDVLSSLFFFLGFLFFLRHRARAGFRPAAWAFGMYLLAFFTKEMAITLPAIFLLYDWSGEVGEHTRDILPALIRALRRYWRGYLVFFGTAILLAFYTVWIENASHQSVYYGKSFLLNFLTMARFIVYYLSLLLVPLKLSAMYSYNAFPLTETPADTTAWLAVMVLLVLAGLIVWSFPRSRWAGFAGGWFFLTLLPVMQIVPHHDFMAEHYLYLPSFGFCLLAGIIFERVLEGNRTRIAAWAFLVLIVVSYSARTIVRNRDWKDQLTLWKRTTETFPECAQAHVNLGTEYNRGKEYEAAVREFTRALEINPRLASPHLGLGNAYLARGKHAAARREYLRAVHGYREYLEMEPDMKLSRMNLGAAYAQLGKFDEAIGEFQRVLGIDPSHVDASFNLGEIYWKMGMIDEAMKYYQRALSNNPDDIAAREALGVIYGQKGMTGKAEKTFKAIIRIKPGYPGAYYNLGLAYIEQGKCREGLELWGKGAAMDPDRGRAEDFIRRMEKARSECREGRDE